MLNYQIMFHEILNNLKRIIVFKYYQYNIEKCIIDH
jgi:hypothetical protein